MNRSKRFYSPGAIEKLPMAELRPSMLSKRLHQHYVPSEELIDAVNVALELGQPLLLTGEPGSGKTALAWHLAEELGLDDPIEFRARSTSVQRDLLYQYDSIGRFRSDKSASARDFIKFVGLGLAIVRASNISEVEDIVPRAEIRGAPSRSVVLIDEIDKAPRDFPNDLLGEIERLEFEIPELGNRRVAADSSFSPIVIVTSNLERQLPDAFLRRCIYFHIVPPTRTILDQIAVRRLSTIPRKFVSEAINFYFHLVEGLDRWDKRPGTAEFLGWLEYLTKHCSDSDCLTSNRPALVASVSILAKSDQDLLYARKVAESWKD